MTKLTDHETEVLSRLAQGYTQKEVAKQMHKTPQEINSAVSYIRKKHRSLEKALEWYRDTHQDQFEADELPDEDEPTGPEPERCGRCGLAEPHRCLEGEDFIYKRHGGNAALMGGKYGHGAKWSHPRFNGEESVFEARVQVPVGRGKH